MLIVALTAVGTVADYGVRVLLARVVDPTAYGDFAIAYAVMMLGGIAAILGADRTIMRFLPRYIAAADHARVSGFVAMFASAAILVAVLLGLLVVLTHLFLDFEGNVFFHTDRGHPMLYAIWIVPFYALSRFSGGLLNSARRPVLMTLARYYLLPVVVTAAILALVAAGVEVGPVAILLAYAGAFALAIVFNLAVMPAHVRYWHADRRVSPKIWLGLSLPVMGSEIVWKFAGYTAPFMLEWLGPEEADVGMFSASFSAGSLILIPFVAVSAIALPRLGLIAAGPESRADRQALFCRTTRQLLALAILFAAPLILFSREILSMFGEEYKAADTALIMTAVALCASAAFGIAASFLQFTGHVKLVLAVVAGATLLDVALCAVLIPGYGLNGAALSFMIRSLVLQAVLILLLWRLEGLVPFVRPAAPAPVRSDVPGLG